MSEKPNKGGTGASLTKAAIIGAGVASLIASLISFVSIWLQTKNYRKPLLQRYVIRILIMVPIYSAASWASIMSQSAAFWLDPVRDIYEAFTIYTFFQLLINFLGGERSLVIMMLGRRPVHHLWPLNHCLAKIDISDPHTFLSVKRGILQYAYIKPILTVSTFIMKATDTYQEGYIGLKSGYLWSGIIYNLSVTLSLYSLGMFWACMSQDLKPFRPVPKFLCIKLIIFASYWQGFFLSILVWLGAIPSDVKGYTPDNLAAAIQDVLICFEMPVFAVSHWYAFSWKDYADITISAARMPVKYAARDAFGIRDLIEDTKETFGGRHYEYRVFDSGDNVLANEESGSRVARMMEGMRYERGGKGKYWIPKPNVVNSQTPLLGGGSGRARSHSPSVKGRRGKLNDERGSSDVGEAKIDEEDERLYANARALEFGDWNYPVITAHVPSRERWLSNEPNILTTATNRNLLQPTKENKKRRASDVQKAIDKGKRRGSSMSGDKPKRKSHIPLLSSLRQESSSSSSTDSAKDQLVDLVIEDKNAEQADRVRARKEGGAEWNEVEAKRFVRAYSDPDRENDVRLGFKRSGAPPFENYGQKPEVEESPFAVEDEGEEEGDASTSRSKNDSDHTEHGMSKANDDAGENESESAKKVNYGNMDEERRAWSAGKDHAT